MSDELDAAVEGALAYEALHVPSLFKQWALPVLDAAGVVSGHSVLDVACGTGVVAREALARVGPTGEVTGLDVGAGMLAVAAELEPGVTWIEGDALDLPFEDGQFDAVASQFGLMFFGDRVQAVSEMLRCAKEGAKIAIAVWGALDHSEAFPTTVDLLDKRVGSDAADALRAPFVLGDTGELRSIFSNAGARAISIDTQVGTARFPSVRTMFEADLRGWLPLMGVFLDEVVIEELLAEAESRLQSFVDDSGAMVFRVPAHIITAST